MSETATKTRKASPRQEANELLQQRIMDMFGPPSRGVQKTRAELEHLLGDAESGQMVHALWRLVEKGKLEIVGTRQTEGARGRAPQLYARPASS